MANKTRTGKLSLVGLILIEAIVFALSFADRSMTTPERGVVFAFLVVIALFACFGDWAERRQLPS